MEFKEIFDKIDINYNDGFDDIFYKELRELSNEDSEKLTVKEFLTNILNYWEEQFKDIKD